MLQMNEYAFLAFFAITQQRERDYQGTFLTACLQGTTFQLTLLRKVVLGMQSDCSRTGHTTPHS